MWIHGKALGVVEQRQCARFIQTSYLPQYARYGCSQPIRTDLNDRVSGVPIPAQPPLIMNHAIAGIDVSGKVCGEPIQARHGVWRAGLRGKGDQGRQHSVWRKPVYDAAPYAGSTDEVKIGTGIDRKVEGSDERGR